jgi:activator of 2-hydroxyglutaryl-CoA dehydratase
MKPVTKALMATIGIAAATKAQYDKFIEVAKVDLTEEETNTLLVTTEPLFNEVMEKLAEKIEAALSEEDSQAVINFYRIGEGAKLVKAFQDNEESLSEINLEFQSKLFDMTSAYLQEIGKFPEESDSKNQCDCAKE